MRLIFWLNGWLVRILCVLAVVVIAAMALGVSAEVILRMFVFPSIIGLIELTEYGAVHLDVLHGAASAAHQRARPRRHRDVARRSGQ